MVVSVGLIEIGHDIRLVLGVSVILVELQWLLDTQSSLRGVQVLCRHT